MSWSATGSSSPAPGPSCCPSPPGSPRPARGCSACSRRAPRSGFARHPAAVLRNLGKLAEGAGYLRVLRRHRVPFHTRQTVVAAHGDDQVRAVTVATLDRDWRVVERAGDRVRRRRGRLRLHAPAGDPAAARLRHPPRRRRQPRRHRRRRGSAPRCPACTWPARSAASAAPNCPLWRVRWPGCTRPAPPRAGGCCGAGPGFGRSRPPCTAPIPSGRAGRPGSPTTPWSAAARRSRSRAIRRAIVDLGATDPRAVKLLARPGMGLCQGQGLRVTRRPAWSPEPVTAADLLGTRRPPDRPTRVPRKSRGTTRGGTMSKPWHGVLVATALPFDDVAGRRLRPVRRARRLAGRARLPRRHPQRLAGGVPDPHARGAGPGGDHRGRGRARRASP